jgi:FG-GAP-like repeat
MKVLALALAAAVLSTQAGGGSATGFTPHEIATGLRGGYQVVVADLNKDGKPDIIALASGLPELLWYENPGWQKHVLATGVSQLINASAYDIDGDGIPEIAVAQGFTTSPKTSKGQIGLLTHGADVTAPWTYQEIDAVPTAHRLRWVDADGSGRKMLAIAPLIGTDSTPPDYKAPMSIFFYRAPDWKREVVTDTLTGLVHGIETAPWDGVKGEVLLSAGFTGLNQYRFANGRWTQTELSKGDPQPWPKSGASDVKLARLGAQKFLATIEPWHGNEVVIYRQAGGSWTRQMIDDQIVDGHTIITLDTDDDGREEIVVGQRGGARMPMLYTASADGASWSKLPLDDEGSMAAAGCAVADLNADKRADIVCIGTATANLKWYENVGKK